MEREEPLDNEECAWTFRGYRLDPAHFTTAMVHLYRGEMSRANTWRTRLDTTTNWAVITTGAALTFAFGAPGNPHFVLLLVLLLVLTFLYIEGRRYRYYELWYYRVHLMETDLLAAMLVPPFRPSVDWANHLAESLLHPSFSVTHWEAIGRRFRRNYVWLISLLLVSWIAKLIIHPTTMRTWSELIGRAAIGPIPGMWVVIAVAVTYIALLTLGVITSFPQRWRERLPQRLRRFPFQPKGPLKPGQPEEERLATIITNHGAAIATRLMDELGRGVTALEGTGMHTGEGREVLLCAVTEVQVPHLREIVRQIDPQAFTVVSAVSEVRGRGFRPFQAPS